MKRASAYCFLHGVAMPEAVKKVFARQAIRDGARAGPAATSSFESPPPVSPVDAGDLVPRGQFFGNRAVLAISIKSPGADQRMATRIIRPHRAIMVIGKVEQVVRQRFS